jgi:hypothetical protein
LEHFSKEHALFLLNEASRVLKPGGIARIVVPDLEQICAEYLRVVHMDDGDPAKSKYYSWMVVELLDQMVRMQSGGEMVKLLRVARTRDDEEFSRYVELHSERMLDCRCCTHKKGFVNRLRNLNWGKIENRILLARLRIAKCFVPRAIRYMVFVETGIGERHQWMYDYYGMCQLLSEVGLGNVERMSHNQSNIDGFNNDYLDANKDGAPYKYDSLYVECVKPL